MGSKMWGADADALDALAQQMHASAGRLDALSKHLSARLMASAWQGADADRFRADWNRRYRGELRHSVEFLRQAQRLITASAADQRAASADSGGNLALGSPVTPPGGALSRALGTGWATARGTAESWQAVTGPLAGLGVLAGAPISGRYSDAYRRLLALPGMRFKQSPTLQRLHGLDGPLSTVLDNPVFKGVSRAAGAVSVAGQAFDTGRVVADFAAGRADGGDLARAGADAAATALKASKNPVSYLVGVNVSIWSDVVETGTSAIESGDFTLRGLPSPFSREAFTQVYVQSAKDVGSQLWSMARKWF